VERAGGYAGGVLGAVLSPILAHMWESYWLSPILEHLRAIHSYDYTTYGRSYFLSLPPELVAWGCGGRVPVLSGFPSSWSVRQ
jgi:hypothetical protein